MQTKQVVTSCTARRVTDTLKTLSANEGLLNQQVKFDKIMNYSKGINDVYQYSVVRWSQNTMPLLQPFSHIWSPIPQPNICNAKLRLHIPFVLFVSLLFNLSEF